MVTKLEGGGGESLSGRATKKELQIESILLDEKVLLNLKFFLLAGSGGMGYFPVRLLNFSPLTMLKVLSDGMLGGFKKVKEKAS